MIKLWWILGVVLVAGFAGSAALIQHPAGGTQQRKPSDDIQKQHAIWQAEHISHYRYSLEVSCLCGFLNQPYTTEVRDGRLISALNGYGQPMSAADVEAPPHSVDWFYSLTTIDSLFDYAANAATRASSVTIRYDPRYGFPTSIVVDWVRGQTGDEVKLRIFNFRVLP